ncbi:hypothetical protein BS47DRAFT_1349775 [Hydnum rufescens UP504]|uniref:Uncharacterized protein n=1 Tax=Hydnum rufescens UP504 TaxID=1448309 RepID=A0A9P6ANB6_9AGAM|nr:hypothetical protein BS47DRAFT_1349775 [Hydnum rufescens UP504]
MGNKTAPGRKLLSACNKFESFVLNPSLTFFEVLDLILGLELSLRPQGLLVTITCLGITATHIR